MACKDAPTQTTTSTIVEHIAGVHKGHRITKVGSVSVDQKKGGGTFQVFYCQDDHILLTDITS